MKNFIIVLFVSVFLCSCTDYDKTSNSEIDTISKHGQIIERQSFDLFDVTTICELIASLKAGIYLK